VRAFFIVNQSYYFGIFTNSPQEKYILDNHIGANIWVFGLVSEIKNKCQQEATQTINHIPK